MCTCMCPRARWKMVHRSYLYMLSLSAMQAGVTCKAFLTTQLESGNWRKRTTTWRLNSQPGSVRWYARRASSMCTCMCPRARWKMVHRSYLYMLSLSAMQAGVTCKAFLTTQLESGNWRKRTTTWRLNSQPGSVRWYARRASSMCTCMCPRARWKMVHRSYLYMLSLSVMQAGVTCTSFSNYTA